MSLLEHLKINIIGLELGTHHYTYEIDDRFFELFDYSMVSEGKLSTELTLEKKVDFLTLDFDINGTVKLVCDRSLDPFDYPLDIKGHQILKFGEEAQELTEEMEVIPYSTQEVDVSKYIYELVTIAIPMKKLHPRYENETTDDQIVFTSDEESSDEEQIDPRWSELKKLKKK